MKQTMSQSFNNIKKYRKCFENGCTVTLRLIIEMNEIIEREKGKYCEQKLCLSECLDKFVNLWLANYNVQRVYKSFMKPIKTVND